MVNIISLIIFKRIKCWLKNFSFLAGSGGNYQEMAVVCGIKFFFSFFVQMIATCKEEMKKSELLEEDVVFLVR